MAVGRPDRRGAEQETLVKRFHCGDVVPGCDQSYVGATEDLVLAQAGAHAASAHGITDPSDELVAHIRSLIRAA